MFKKHVCIIYKIVQIYKIISKEYHTNTEIMDENTIVQAMLLFEY